MRTTTLKLSCDFLIEKYTINMAMTYTYNLFIGKAAKDIHRGLVTEASPMSSLYARRFRRTLVAHTAVSQ